jgi:hypothetical protein
LEIVYSHDRITPEEVIRFLALTGQGEAIFSEIIKTKEAVKKARDLQMEVSETELQHFADNFRALRGLYSAEEMLAFLENATLTEDDFTTFCESSVLTVALIDRLADEKKIEEYFVHHRSEFDFARISIIVVEEMNLASEIVMQVTEEGENFHTLARKHSRDQVTKHAGGYVGWISREFFPQEVNAKMFSASPGDLIGPLEKDGTFQLILVEEVRRATLDRDVRETIRERIFQEWASNYLKKGIRITL